MHLPFLQTVLASFTLVPLVVGDASDAEVADVLEQLWDGPETLVVISSDLSHYLAYAAACARDARTCDAIKAFAADRIGHGDACGATPVRGLLVAARRHGLQVTTVDLRNSGDTAGDRLHVVGYGAWTFTEPEGRSACLTRACAASCSSPACWPCPRPRRTTSRSNAPHSSTSCAVYAGGLTAFSFREDVLEAIDTVERHEFVPDDEIEYAYQNRPLPIGHGQTISQPYIVALMTELLEPEADDVVLEIGTGSGYQAAILAELVGEVYTIEIIETLAHAGRSCVSNASATTTSTTRLGDGYFGWPEQAPFDSIVVTAAATHVPPPLVEQLKPGGKMVIPVGGRFTTQWLLLVEKNADGEVVTRQVTAVRFVPLTGER